MFEEFLIFGREILGGQLHHLLSEMRRQFAPCFFHQPDRFDSLNAAFFLFGGLGSFVGRLFSSRRRFLARWFGCGGVVFLFVFPVVVGFLFGIRFFVAFRLLRGVVLFFLVAFGLRGVGLIFIGGGFFRAAAAGFARSAR